MGFSICGCGYSRLRAGPLTKGPSSARHGETVLFLKLYRVLVMRMASGAACLRDACIGAVSRLKAEYCQGWFSLGPETSAFASILHHSSRGSASLPWHFF